MIERDYSLFGSCLLAEEATGSRGSGRPAFAWPAGVQLSALAAAAQVDAERCDDLLRYARCLDSHWITHQGFAGYNASANNSEPDRYYDDNAWLVLGLIEAYEATGEPWLLTRAEEAFAFVMSGEDSRLGGGLYWRENHRQTKNTCSNAPAIVCSMRLYEHTSQPHYHDIGRRLYDWVCERLQDDRSGLLNDHARLDGTIDHRKYTYNTGLMIRASLQLHEATGQESYLQDAEDYASAAGARWVDPDTSVLVGEAKFAHLLLEALIDLDQHASEPRWQPVADATLAWLHCARDPVTGRYPRRWSPGRLRRSASLIDQASAARAFYRQALVTEQAIPGCKEPNDARTGDSDGQRTALPNGSSSSRTGSR